MSVDLVGLGALVLVSAEWLALGWLSGVRFPQTDRRGAFANWALWVLVGACLVALAQLKLAALGLGFSLIPAVLVLAMLGAVGLRLVSTSRAELACHSKVAAMGRRERVGWTLLGLVVLVALARAVMVPEAGWDAYSHWGLRAQAFATRRAAVVDAHSEHEYYPPLVPLLEAWLYLHRGMVSIDLGKTVWAVIGGAFAVCLAWHLRLSLRSVWLAPYLALGIVLTTTALIEGFWTGQADLALTAFLTLATLAAWQWQRTRDRGWLLQIGVFAAAAALTQVRGPATRRHRGGSHRGRGRPRRSSENVGARAVPRWASRCWYPGCGSLVEVRLAITPNGEHVGAFQPLAIGGILLALAAVFGGVRTGGALVVVALAWATAARTLLCTATASVDAGRDRSGRSRRSPHSWSAPRRPSSKSTHLPHGSSSNGSRWPCSWAQSDSSRTGHL